jgi:uncharacterized protein YciI
MKHILLPLLLLCVSYLQTSAQDNPKYDKALADSLGADKYGMKMYFLVILKTGSNAITDKEKLNELFKGHMSNINKLVQSGKLVVAGPLGKNDKQYRGIFILNAKTPEEVNTLLEGDPALKEKLMEVEIFPWYGSAALPKYLEYHEKIEQTKH